MLLSAWGLSCMYVCRAGMGVYVCMYIHMLLCSTGWHVRISYSNNRGHQLWSKHRGGSQLRHMQQSSSNAQFLGRSASVCVSHLSLVCGGGWVRWEILDTPPVLWHLSRKSSVPLSFGFLLALSLVTFSLLTHCGWAACSLFSSLYFLSLFHNTPPPPSCLPRSVSLILKTFVSQWSFPLPRSLETQHLGYFRK